MRRDEVTARLTAGHPATDAAGLWEAFGGAEVRALCEGDLWLGPTTPSLIRNAVGRELAAAASDAALAEQGCDWSPCCAFSLFFQNLDPVAGAALIPVIDAAGPGRFWVGLRLLGWAALWTDSLADALARGLRGGLGRRGDQVTRLAPRLREIEPAPVPMIPAGPLRITAATAWRPRDKRPFPEAGSAAPPPIFELEDWFALGRSITDRLTAAAPWFDLRFDPDAAAALRAEWNAAAVGATVDLRWVPAVVGARGRKPTDLSGWVGEITLPGPSPALATALGLLQALHVGRHVGKGGLGRLWVAPL